MIHHLDPANESTVTATSRPTGILLSDVALSSGQVLPPVSLHAEKLGVSYSVS